MTLIPCPYCGGHGLVERPEPEFDAPSCPTCASFDPEIRGWNPHVAHACPDPWHREKR
jgi:hypothetical protein